MRGSGAGTASERRSCATTVRAARTIRGSSRTPAAASRCESASSCPRPGLPSAVSAAQVRATAAMRADWGMIVPGTPAGPPAPFHHSVTWPAAQETSLQSTTVWLRCLPGSPSTSRLWASRRTASSSLRCGAVEVQVHGHRTRVAAGRGQRVERGDGPGAGRVGERALREHGDEREQGEGEDADGRVGDDGDRAEQHHHGGRGRHVAQRLGHPRQRDAEPERAVDGRADGPAQDEEDRAGGDAPGRRPRAPRRRRSRRPASSSAAATACHPPEARLARLPARSMRSCPVRALTTTGAR